jgi:hypothetical protein
MKAENTDLLSRVNAAAYIVDASCAGVIILEGDILLDSISCVWWDGLIEHSTLKSTAHGK